MRSGAWEDQQTWMSDREIDSLGGQRGSGGYPGPINQPQRVRSPENGDVLIKDYVTLDTNASVRTLTIASDLLEGQACLAGSGTVIATERFVGGRIKGVTVAFNGTPGPVELEDGATLRPLGGEIFIDNSTNPLRKVHALTTADMPNPSRAGIAFDPIGSLRFGSAGSPVHPMLIRQLGGHGTVLGSIILKSSRLNAGNKWMHMDTLPKTEVNRPFLSIRGDLSLTDSDLWLYAERQSEPHEMLPLCFVDGSVNLDRSSLIMRDDPRAEQSAPGTVRLLMTAKRIQGTPTQLGFRGTQSSDLDVNGTWWALDIDRQKFDFLNSAESSPVPNSADCLMDLAAVARLPWRVTSSAIWLLGKFALAGDGAVAHPASRSNAGNQTIDALCLSMPKSADGRPLRLALQTHRKLIVVTHGTNSSIGASEMAEGGGGLTDVVRGLYKVVQRCGLDKEWGVVALDWHEFATGPDSTREGVKCGFLFNPFESARVGQQIGRAFADLLAATPGGPDLTEVHLLGHSSGAWLVDGIADRLKEIEDRFPAGKPKVTLTLFDAFDLPEYTGALGTLADTADVAEHYFDTTVLPGTNGRGADLPQNTVGIDVTGLRPAVELDPTTGLPQWFLRRSGPLGSMNDALGTVVGNVNPFTGHAWPYAWYIRTLDAMLSPTNTCEPCFMALDCYMREWGAVRSPVFQQFLRQQGDGAALQRGLAASQRTFDRGTVIVLPERR